jgi:hypothetical protein
MKGSVVLLGQRIRVYHDRDRASRHTYAVVFMDRRFDRGQYEALLMNHRPPIRVKAYFRCLHSADAKCPKWRGCLHLFRSVLRT